MRPSTASPIYLCAYFQRVLDVAPSPLALAETARQHTLLATMHKTSAVATTTCLDYLHSHTRTMRPSTASPINSSLLPAGIGWYPGPRTQNRHTTPQLWPHKRPHGHQTTYMHILSMIVGLRTSTWPLIPFVQPEHSSSADI
jgi:hypothetical protein